MQSITPVTMQQLSASPALVAIKLHSKHVIPKDQPDDDKDDLYEESYDLVIASNAIINDDPLAASVFAGHIFCAPQEDILESFYAALGSPRLSTLVKVEYRTGDEVKTVDAAAQAKKMRNLLLERLPLFVHDMRSTSRSLAYTSEYLQKPENIQISIVQKISRVITFTQRNVPKVEEQDISASAKRKPSTDPTIKRGPIALSLIHTTHVDMYEVASGLCRLILKQPRAQDSLLLLTLLTTSLRSLGRRGYNSQSPVRCIMLCTDTVTQPIASFNAERPNGVRSSLRLLLRNSTPMANHERRAMLLACPSIRSNYLAPRSLRVPACPLLHRLACRQIMPQKPVVHLSNHLHLRGQRT